MKEILNLLNTAGQFLNTVQDLSKPSGYVIKTKAKRAKLKDAQLALKADIELNGEPYRVQLLFGIHGGDNGRRNKGENSEAGG